ncbi:fimbrillin family protein [Butyricimonas paravirosa]|uniref:fimbrillin family protein n=1 Tax=Butyricimonas paravirosa TaxID=1472417 RepID=UPI00210A4A06|nr:fimbrillin family protein [Butyricimonas paravirosa]MCQ4875664.1 fimbrillin family protein [Butyricimonas paravirosa]
MKTIYFLLVVIGAIFCTSCNKESGEEIISPSKSLLSVTTDLNEMVSRAAMPANTQMGLFVTSGSLGSVYDNTSSNNNVKAVLSGSGWTLTPAVYLSANNATLYAYTPYASSVTSGTSVPVAVGTGKADYCYGKSSGTINAKTPSATINMNHALTKVRFKLSKTATYTGIGKLTEIAINGSTNNTVCASGTLNVSTGVITATVSSSHVITQTNASGLYTITTSAPTDASAATLDMALIPANFQEKEINVAFTIDGKIFNFSVPAGSWESGKINTYTLSLGGAGLTMASASVIVEDWTNGITASGELK